MVTATDVYLDAGDAAELAELLAFGSDWLGSGDTGPLEASLARFVGIGAYDVAELRADLTRFVLLLGGVEAERLFGDPEHG